MANSAFFQSLLTELAKSKGIKHLVEGDSLLEKDSADLEGESTVDATSGDDADSVCGSKRPASDAGSALLGGKRPKTSRQVFRDVLDGVVDPEILDSCVEDLEIITAHSGSQLCELVRVTQQIRNERDAMAEANADIDEKEGSDTPVLDSASQHSPSFPPNYATDGIEFGSSF